MSAPGTRPGKADDMLLLPSSWAHEKGFSTNARILELWDNTIPVISGTGADRVCSFSPSAGQRDQYQSQGAAQAPLATQIGQRGQGMGRGRGQDFQAGTSGTQGRFYAVVPHTEHAD